MASELPVAFHRTGSAAGGRTIATKGLLYLVLIVVAFVCAGPYLWMLSTSFKGNENIYHLTLIPRHPTLLNYVGVVRFLHLFRYIGNTLYITIFGILLDVVFSTLCAYPLAKYSFHGKRVVTGILLSTQILPATAGLIVNYLTVGALGLMGGYWAVILPTSITVFSIILFRQAYLAIPNGLIEAARIDGAGELRVWGQILIPQIMPAISTIIIFDFIFKWNNFLWPIIVLNNDKYPIAAALNYLTGQFNFQFGYIAAGTIISVVPIVAVFLAFQKSYISAVAGAVKG